MASVDNMPNVPKIGLYPIFSPLIQTSPMTRNLILPIMSKLVTFNVTKMFVKLKV